MSSLLERAIIDATALKDAALKNAERLVVEKYSKEIKSAMENLLEQDELGMTADALGGDPMAADPMAADPMAADPMAADPMAADPMAADPMAAPEPGAEEEEVEAPFDKDSVVAEIPDAFSPDVDDDQILRIKLDSLEMDEFEEDGMFGGDDKLDADEIGINIGSDEEPEEALAGAELEDDDVGIDITSDIVAEAVEELGSDEEIDLDGLMEELEVDIDPQKSGWAGTPEPQMKEYEDMLLAAEQDDENSEELEELRDTVEKLQEENKTLASAARKLKAQNEKFHTTFDALQEKLEFTNVSNAKLLYINQALENASLNERQKRKLVEAISKARTVQEAKIVFDALHETVVSSPAGRKNASLNEVVSRKSSLLVAARKEQTQENTVNPLFNRMQKLAGIKT